VIDLRSATAPAETVIHALGLHPHPEGGHFRETWRDRPPGGERGVGTAILFLLRAGEFSHWHRVDADELWVWQAGAALTLSVSPDGHGVTNHALGPDLGRGEFPQQLIPRQHWQAAWSEGAWTLVTCTVCPAFEFSGFTLAPPGWRPTPG
jgi:predicted cupin superfamily sugar epimerase